MTKPDKNWERYDAICDAIDNLEGELVRIEAESGDPCAPFYVVPTPSSTPLQKRLTFLYAQLESRSQRIRTQHWMSK